jgi:hypothetical protein
LNPRYAELRGYLQITIDEPLLITNLEASQLLSEGYDLIEQQVMPDGSASEFKTALI